MMKITKGCDAEDDERHEGYEEAEDTKQLLRSTKTIIRKETIKGEVKDGKETWEHWCRPAPTCETESKAGFHACLTQAGMKLTLDLCLHIFEGVFWKKKQ